MADDSAPVFVLTVEAVAGPSNSVPDGKRYALLVFARGKDEAAADAGARNGLAALGWDTPDVLRSGEITDASGIPEDLQRAYANACKYGCAVVVYDEP